MASEQQAIQVFFQSLDAPQKVLYTATDIFLKYLKGLPDRPSKEMVNLLENGDADATVTGTFEQAQEIKRRMDEQGISPVKAMNYKGQGVVLTPQEDREKAQEIVNDYFAETEKHLHVSVDQLNSYADGEVKEVTVPEETGIILLSRCEEAGITTAVLQPEEGQCKILFAEKDSEKFDAVRAKLAADLTSSKSDALKEQAEWKNTYVNNIRNAVVNGKNPDDTPIRPGTTVVDMEGQTITFNRTNITMRNRDGHVQTVSRSSKHLNEAAIRFFENVKDPAVLSKEEFRDFSELPNDQRSDYIFQKQREDTTYSDGRPTYTEEQLREFANEENKNREKADSIVEVPVEHEGDTVEHTEKMDLEQASRELGLMSDEENQYAAFSSQPRDTDSIDDEDIEKVESIYDSLEPEDADDLETDKAYQQLYRDIFHADGEQSQDIDGYGFDAFSRDDSFKSGMEEKELYDQMSTPEFGGD